jgi:hypothetical protein
VKRKKTQGCPHPPSRHYAGVCYDPGTNRNEMWIACCACGTLLKEAYSQATCDLAARTAAEKAE